MGAQADCNHRQVMVQRDLKIGQAFEQLQPSMENLRRCERQVRGDEKYRKALQDLEHKTRYFIMLKSTLRNNNRQSEWARGKRKQTWEDAYKMLKEARAQRDLEGLEDGPWWREEGDWWRVEDAVAENLIDNQAAPQSCPTRPNEREQDDEKDPLHNRLAPKNRRRRKRRFPARKRRQKNIGNELQALDRRTPAPTDLDESMLGKQRSVRTRATAAHQHPRIIDESTLGS